MSVRVGVDVDHSASRISGILAVVAAAMAMVSVALASVLALIFGLLGVVAVATGVFVLDSRTGVVVGCAILFLGVIVSGMMAAPVAVVLAATIATILAMDLGQNAVSVGNQMTTDAYTRRGEFVHAGGSVVVGVLVAGLAYGIYLVSPSGQPLSALILLLLAAVLLIWSFRT